MRLGVSCPECGGDDLTEVDTDWGRSFDTVTISDMYSCRKCHCQFEISQDYVKRGGPETTVYQHGNDPETIIFRDDMETDGY